MTLCIYTQPVNTLYKPQFIFTPHDVVVTPPQVLDTPFHSSPTLDTPSYPHQVVNDQFPGIRFLGKPHEVTVESDPIIISPPGHGVTLKIPPNAAVQSSDKPVNVSLQTCLSSSVFEGFTRFSAIYHISSDTPFDKDMELTFEHFADLKTNQQANMMRFFRAESKGERRYIFTPMEGGEIKVGSHSCTISTRQFSFVCAGSEPSSQIGKFILIRLVSLLNQLIVLSQTNDTLCCAAILTRLRVLDILLLLYLWMMLYITLYVISPHHMYNVYIFVIYRTSEKL